MKVKTTLKVEKKNMNSPCAWRRLATALDRIATAVTVQDTLLNYLMAIDDTLQCNWKSFSKMLREDVLNSARSVGRDRQWRAGGRRERTWRSCGMRGARREERGVSRERSAGHCVHVLYRTATAGKAIFTRETIVTGRAVSARRG